MKRQTLALLSLLPVLVALLLLPIAPARAAIRPGARQVLSLFSEKPLGYSYYCPRHGFGPAVVQDVWLGMRLTMVHNLRSHSATDTVRGAEVHVDMVWTQPY